MQATARVVIIGGGICGVSTLYHLAKKGWSDSVLLERTELTAGSTWHAAGLLPLFNVNYTVGQLHQYSLALYKGLETETGQAVGYHGNGNLRLATNRDRLDEYRLYQCNAENIGVESHLLSVDDVKRMWPLMKADGLEGALWHPDDGHIAPVDVTMALARGARAMGAEILQQTRVTAIERDNNEWVVKTDSGTEIRCEHVVSATGNYAMETARSAGLQIPAVPVEHQYIITDVDPALKAYRESGADELPTLREPDSSYYVREERLGWIFGCYEKGAPARFANGVPASFQKDLFPASLDRLMPHIEACIKRVPSFEQAGIKDIVNGPISYTPDGNPMIGPAFGLPNYWLSEGHSFGVTAAGGAGWQLAEWITEGEPGLDMLPLDPRRFGVTTKHYASIKAEEAYSHVFLNHYPMEEREAGRRVKTVPCHDRLDRAGAIWSSRFGWERPNWFAKAGEERRDIYSYRRSNWFEPVAREVALARESACLMELSSVSKFMVEGRGARQWLEGLLANALPQKDGAITLCHALYPSGTVRSEFTVTKLPDGLYGERFYLTGPAGAHDMDLDILGKALPHDGSVFLQDVTGRYGVFVLAGPHARAILQKLADADVSKDAFPWLTARDIPVGFCPEVRAMRMTFTGSLGWELHHPIEYQNHLFDALMEGGKEFGLGLAGMCALNSLRLEKSYRLWGADLNAECSILEAGLERFVRFDKDFVGRQALLESRSKGIPYRHCTLEVDADDADCFGREPIYIDGQLAGRGTAGGYGHHVKKSLLLGYVKAEHAETGRECEVRILDQRRPARIVEESPYDPGNKVLRN